MMQAADLGESDNFPDPMCLYRPLLWAVLIEREMGSCSVVVVDVRRKYPAQMALVENDDMVQTLAPDRADDSFDIRILPG
jgi:hypothetical protein